MGSPAWSPDGEWVAFWVRDWLSPSDVKLKLYKARADGSGLTLLRDFSAQPGPYPSNNFLPSDGLNWSPTGKELVYTHGDLLAFNLTSGAIRVLLANNNRIAHPALMLTFLVLNGIEPTMTSAQLFEATMRVAVGKLDRAKLAEFLRAHSGNPSARPR